MSPVLIHSFPSVLVLLLGKEGFGLRGEFVILYYHRDVDQLLRTEKWAQFTCGKPVERLRLPCTLWHEFQ